MRNKEIFKLADPICGREPLVLQANGLEQDPAQMLAVRGAEPASDPAGTAAPSALESSFDRHILADRTRMVPPPAAVRRIEMEHWDLQLWISKKLSAGLANTSSLTVYSQGL